MLRSKAPKLLATALYGRQQYRAGLRNTRGCVKHLAKGNSRRGPAISSCDMIWGRMCPKAPKSL
jgi:hypothetical protein